MPNLNKRDTYMGQCLSTVLISLIFTTWSDAFLICPNIPKSHFLKGRSQNHDVITTFAQPSAVQTNGDVTKVINNEDDEKYIDNEDNIMAFETIASLTATTLYQR